MESTDNNAQQKSEGNTNGITVHNSTGGLNENTEDFEFEEIDSDEDDGTIKLLALSSIPSENSLSAPFTSPSKTPINTIPSTPTANTPQSPTSPMSLNIFSLDVLNGSPANTPIKSNQNTPTPIKNPIIANPKSNSPNTPSKSPLLSPFSSPIPLNLPKLTTLDTSPLKSPDKPLSVPSVSNPTPSQSSTTSSPIVPSTPPPPLSTSQSNTPNNVVPSSPAPSPPEASVFSSSSTSATSSSDSSSVDKNLSAKNRMTLEDGVTVVWSKEEDRAILYAAKSKTPDESFIDCWMRQSEGGKVTKSAAQVEKRYSQLMELMQLYNSKSTRPAPST